MSGEAKRLADAIASREDVARSTQTGQPLGSLCGVHCGTDSRGTSHCVGCHVARSQLSAANAVDEHERGHHGRP